MFVTSETNIKVFAALVAMQPEIDEAIKSSKNPFLNNNYANLNDVNEVLKEPLKKNNLAVLQPLITKDGDLYVRTMIIHNSGEFIASEMKVPLKNYENAQSVGSGITYTRRYALKAIFNIGDKDDDGNEAAKVPIDQRINNATSIQDLEFILKGLEPKDKTINANLIESVRARFLTNNQQFRQQPQQGQQIQQGYTQPQPNYQPGGYPNNNNFNPQQ